MTRYAVIENGVVANVVLAEPGFANEQGWVEAPAHVSPGWLYDGQTWSEPPLPSGTRDQVIAERDRRLELVASGYTERERETWHVQIKEAEALLADPAAPAPLLSTRAAARGVSVVEFAQTVISLNNQFAAATGAIMGAADVLLAMDPIPSDVQGSPVWPSMG